MKMVISESTETYKLTWLKDEEGKVAMRCRQV